MASVDKSTNTGDSVVNKDSLEAMHTRIAKHAQALTTLTQRVIQLEFERERQRLDKLGLGGRGKPSRLGDESDDEDDAHGGGSTKAIGEDDITELVTELQGQLDLLDDRSVRRTANVLVTDDNDAIAPLPGRDGTEPNEAGEEGNIFPKTYGQFKALKDAEVEYWSRWYELLPPDEQELRDILKRAGTTMEQMGVEKKLEGVDATREEIDANFDKLARYLGVRHRRIAGTW